MARIYFDGREIAGQVQLARTFGTRLKGLMFKKALPSGGGLLLSPCSSVHMCFMRMALDVVYLSGDYAVLHVDKSLKPWKLGSQIKGCRHVLELAAGTAQRCGIIPGGRIAIRRCIEGTRERRDVPLEEKLLEHSTLC